MNSGGKKPRLRVGKSVQPRRYLMFHLNGKENGVMTPRQPSPSESDNTSTSTLHLWGLRLWMACAIIIVAAGVANYVLNIFVRE
jgi:hypothetical protein